MSSPVPDGLETLEQPDDVPVLADDHESLGDDDVDTGDSEGSLQTFAYQMACRNSIYPDHLESGGIYDVNEYPPVFVDRILQLPGTLAHVLGLDSVLDLQTHMIKACLVHGNNGEIYKMGMLLLGLAPAVTRRISLWKASNFREPSLCCARIALRDGSERDLRAWMWTNPKELESGQEDGESGAWSLETEVNQEACWSDSDDGSCHHATAGASLGQQWTDSVAEGNRIPE